MGKDYYKILGVNKNATKDEIKKAFYKLAHQHHPDKNAGNDVKFKEINEAYQTLSDDTKRKSYDTYGSAGPGAGRGGGNYSYSQGGFEGFDFGNMHFDFGGGDFSDLFGFGNSKSSRKKQGEDLQIAVGITFSESILGAKKKIVFNRHANCPTCKGEGAEPGSKKHECAKCHGKGVVTTMRKTIFGNMQQQTECFDCNGLGKIYDKKCHDCKGEGVKIKKEEIEISVPENVENGQQLLMRGYGETVPHGSSGDLYILIKIQKNKTLTKRAKEILEELKKEGY